MKYSIVFPSYDPDRKRDELIARSLFSVVANSEGHDYEIIPVRNVKGFTTAVNTGFAKATGDYLIMVADDVVIEDPAWLKKMAVPNAITAWRMVPFFLTGEQMPDAACWGMSRGVYQKIGPMDDIFAEGYGFDDNDYWWRAKQLGIELVDANVQLYHKENDAYNQYWGPERQALLDRNQAIFRQKWGL